MVLGITRSDSTREMVGLPWHFGLSAAMRSDSVVHGSLGRSNGKAWVPECSIWLEELWSKMIWERLRISRNRCVDGHDQDWGRMEVGSAVGLPDEGVAVRCGEGMWYQLLIDVGLGVQRVTGGRARYSVAAIVLRWLIRLNGAGQPQLMAGMRVRSVRWSIGGRGST
jgi:hypothetical protein